MELAPNHIRVVVAKALGGSFKLVTPRTVRAMTQLPKETQKNGETYKSKRTNKRAKHKPKDVKNTLGSTGLYELVLVAVLQPPVSTLLGVRLALRL